MVDNNFFDDIRPLTKRTEKVPHRFVQEEDEEEEIIEEPRRRREPQSRGGVIWFVVLLSIAVLAVVLSFFFSRADVTIVAKRQHLSVNDTMIFTRGSDDVFEIMKISDSVQETAEGETKEVSKVEKAKGQVTLYNEQATPQTLIVNTRLESPDGKIFRIQARVSVPAGTSAKPGTATATAVADVAGPEYNIAPTKFTIPGLKGGSAFDKVYAKSTTAFTGGFNGKVTTLVKGDTSTHEESLTNKLKAALSGKIKEQVPEGYIYLAGAYTLSAEPASIAVNEQTKTATLTKTGTLSVVLIPRQVLENKLKQKIILQENVPVQITNTDTVSAVITSPTTVDENTQSVTLLLTGDVEYTWAIDTQKMALDLMDKKKNTFNQYMTDYAKGIDRAELIIRPFWVSTIPNNPQRIKIHIQ